jgi:hypothetical protein
VWRKNLRFLIRYEKLAQDRIGVRALFVLSVVGHTKALLPASLPGGPNESLTVTVAKSNFVPGY